MRRGVFTSRRAWPHAGRGVLTSARCTRKPRCHPLTRLPLAISLHTRRHRHRWRARLPRRGPTAGALSYYENVSAFVDNDDYFELMLRNAWHLTGGVGAAANSTNRRVLVTHADGSQSVEEIQHDLGLKADDKAGMMARLKAQGVNAANISTFDGGDDNDKGAPSHFHDVKESMSAGSAQGARSFAAGGTGRKPGAGGGVFASSISIGDGGVSASQKLGLSDRPTGRIKYEDARLLLATDVWRFLAVVVATPNRDVTRRLDTSTSSLSSSVVVGHHS